MPDNLFDNFVNGKLNDHEAPVPPGVWDKITEQQFDEFIGAKLKDQEAPVPTGVWDKIADGQLDNFFGSSLRNYTAAVPDGLWDKVSDGQIDHFFADKFDNYIAPVPAGAWAGVGDGQFDHFFADKLSGYEAPVPEGLWEKIHPEEDKDRKVIYWWRLPVAASLLLAVLIGGAMGAYFWLRPDGNHLAKTPSANTTSLPNKGVANNAAPASGAQTQPTILGMPTQKDAEKNKSGNTAEPALPPTTVAPAQKQNNTINERNSASLPSNGNGTTGNTVNIHGVQKHPGEDQQLMAVPVTKNKRIATNNLLSNRGHDTPFVAGSNANGSDLTAQNSVPPVTANADHNEDGSSFVLPAYQSSFVPNLTIPTDLGRKYHSDLSGLTLADNKHASKFKSNIICPTSRSNANSDWLLEVYASPDVSFRSLSAGTASAQYLQKKDSSSQMQVGFTAGARIVKPLTDNILLKAGVQYTQMNEKYAYRTENEIKTTTVVTVRTIIRAPGDTVVVSDTSTLQTIGFKNNTIRNRYRSIDIPVTIGYQFGNEDLKIGINAGVIFNMTSWYQGVILDTSLSVVPLTKTNNMVYKSKLGLGLYAGINVSKQLGEGLQIFFEPYFRYNLSNMTSSQAGYNQKFSLGGLSVGLRFNLNRP